MTPFDAGRDGVLLDELAPDLPARASLLRFAELVSTWGKRTDLVAAATPTELVSVLFVDALALRAVIPEGSQVIDVGAGAGAPAIPLALLRPDLRVDLLEPRRRRVAFMRTAVGDLQLSERLRVREGRLDDPPDIGGFDVAFSRATFPPAEWLRRGTALAPRVVVMLGKGDAPSLEGWQVVREVAYTVPATAAARHLVAYEASGALLGVT